MPPVERLGLVVLRATGSPRPFRLKRLYAVLVLCGLGLLSGLSTPPPATAAGCVPQLPEYAATSRNVCIAGQSFRARGYHDVRCYASRPVGGQRYPRPGSCGGGPNNIEFIAHSRFNGELGYDPRGVKPQTQWEVRVNSRRNRADTTHDTEGPNGEIDLYEVKRTTNADYLSTYGQLATYTLAFSGRGVATRLGSAPYRDYYLVGASNCEKDGRVVQANRVFISWRVSPGVIAVWEAPFVCFDAAREPIPVPEPARVRVPTENGSERWEDVPVDVIPQGIMAQPVPGTTLGLGQLPLPTQAPATITQQPTNSGSTGASGGDPHLTTLDGLGFDFQAAGEFQVVEADGVNIQARFTKQGSSASAVDRIAFELGERVVEIEPPSARLRIDGELTWLLSGNMLDFGDGSSIVRSGNSYQVAWPGEGVRPSLRTAGRFVSYFVPSDRSPQGLLGDADGDPNNDLMLGDGTRLPATSSAAEIHGAYADSWRITEEESLLSYGPGESTATFTDRAFPETILSIGDFPDEVVAEGTAACSQANVTDGRPFENCLLDWAITRQQAFVDAAADDDVPSIEAGARTVGADGVVTEDFESSVAPNFSAPRYGSGAGTGRYAGPFGRDGRYSASVGRLPGHEAATVQFDLITIGAWPSDAPDPVTVTINGTTAWTGDVTSRTARAQGTTPGGQPYAVYPISVTRPHSDDQLALGVSARLPLGASRAFGVDNLRAALELVAPETFNVSLPLQAPKTSLPGAGALETTGSEDRYRFALADADEVQVDVTSCPSSAAWTLSRVSDGEVLSLGGCGSKRSPALTAGSYELSVTSRGRIGAYKLAVAAVPDPQRFSVSLPTVVSDGFPGPGAGRLETTASQDDYEFSTSVTGGVTIDFAGCTGGLGSVTWRLVDAVSGITHASGYSCGSRLVPNLKAGLFRLEVSGNGRTGTYVASIDAQPAPQMFAVQLPAAIQDGAPAGAGNLETKASADVYTFRTSTSGGLVIDMSDCSSTLGAVNWELTSAAGGLIRAEEQTCGGAVVPNVPAGDYQLEVSHEDYAGTYRLRLQSQPAPEQFSLSLPAAVQDGSPAGAGNLETSGSQDDYSFTAPAGDLQIDVASCSAALQAVDLQLKNAAGATVAERFGACSSLSVPDLPGGSYKLTVKSPAWNQRAGTYKLGVRSAPPPQTFQVAPPATISNGAPASGAGNLETTASEDRYQFTTIATTTVQLSFSDCASSLTAGIGSWELIQASTGQLVSQGGWECSSSFGAPEARDIPAGAYQVRIRRNGAQGTYRLRLLAEAPQRFAVTLPAAVTDGSPAAGAGSLETSASEDSYAFETSSSGALQIDVSNCSSTLPSVGWKLVTENGSEVASSGYTWKCSSKLLPDVPAGRYVLRVTSPQQKTGTYRLSLFAQPAPQTFPVEPPASISDGAPAAGAGALETTASEDRYQFETTTTTMVQLGFSDCTGSLANFGTGTWRLVDVSTGIATASGTWNCDDEAIAAARNVLAGTYRIEISRNGSQGTYRLALLAEAPQRQTISLPASISDGVPATGAGRLESTASEDVYTFQTETADDLIIDVSDCSGQLGSVVWSLRADAGATQASSPGTCGGSLVSKLPAGRYHLAVSQPGKTGTYRLQLVPPPPPQTFAVSLPASVSNGSPATGAGNLETSVSEDRYDFRTATSGNLQLSFSECASSLQGQVSYKLIRASTDATVASATSSCGQEHLENLPSGGYQLRVTRPGASGTYRLGLVAASPQRFDAPLPASVRDGVPASGAGNLETTASEDIYAFQTDAAGGLEVNASECSTSLVDLNWKLIDEDGKLWHTATGTCTSKLVPNLPAGRYSLLVKRPGRTGTYRLNVISQAPQTFQVSLPASISDGIPTTGAGNIETTASEDRYVFTTVDDGTIYLGFSQCSSSLAKVDWRLYNDAGAIVSSASGTCTGGSIRGRPAGRYTLAVLGGGATGTYRLNIIAAKPDVFSVPTPSAISNGVPAPGAGNLEVAASEDRYNFTTAATGKVQFGFSECSTGLGTVAWRLVDDRGLLRSYSSSYACAIWTLSDVPAGAYQLQIFNPGRIGTYKLDLQAAAPQRFDVTLPATISNGSPAGGAGNLETPVSEDVYAFDMSSTNRLKITFSDCSASSKVSWKLIDSAGAEVKSKSNDCASTIAGDVAPGPYKLKVTGSAGTYKLQLAVPIAAQLFGVTLPASISNGSPAAGAGNIETVDSEDRYRFTISSTSTLKLAFSECAGTELGTVTWSLVNVATKATEGGADDVLCNSPTVFVPSGTYEVRVSKVGIYAPLQPLEGLLKKPTYKLQITRS